MPPVDKAFRNANFSGVEWISLCNGHSEVTGGTSNRASAILAERLSLSKTTEEWQWGWEKEDGGDWSRQKGEADDAFATEFS